MFCTYMDVIAVWVLWVWVIVIASNDFFDGVWGSLSFNVSFIKIWIELRRKISLLLTNFSNCWISISWITEMGWSDSNRNSFACCNASNEDQELEKNNHSLTNFIITSSRFIHKKDGSCPTLFYKWFKNSLIKKHKTGSFKTHPYSRCRTLLWHWIIYNIKVKGWENVPHEWH